MGHLVLFAANTELEDENLIFEWPPCTSTTFRTRASAGKERHRQICISKIQLISLSFLFLQCEKMLLSSLRCADKHEEEFVGVMTVTNVPTGRSTILSMYGLFMWKIFVFLFSIPVNSVPSPICPILPFKHFLWDSCCAGLSLSPTLPLSLTHTRAHAHTHTLWWLRREVSCLWRVGFLVSVQKCVTRDTHGLLEAGILTLMGPAAVGTTWGYGRRDGWMGEDCGGGGGGR